MGRVAIAAALVLVSCWASAEALGMHPHRKSVNSVAYGIVRSMQQTNLTHAWEERWYEQTLDHFTSRNDTFQQRYMFAPQYWKGPQTSAPIFLYCGLESAIDDPSFQQGFIWDIAPSFGALVVFTEHRYYGSSLPFGNRTDPEAMEYLSSEQALADYVALITDLKMNLSAEASPVVLFGCSYGAMLASWFRLKYSHIAIGAIASSAPILMSLPSSEYIYYDKVAKDYRDASESCYQTFKNSFNIISNITTKEGLHNLSMQFGFCSDLESPDELMDWIESACAAAAQYDNPPSSTFPGYPLEEMCKDLDKVGGGSNGLAGVAAAMQLVYHNYSGLVSQCFVPFSNDTGFDTWGWQTCTEQVQPFGIRANSMFPPYAFNITVYEEMCLTSYGVKPRPHWVTEEFGGENVGAVLKLFGSNIVFANGLKDPYSGMSVLQSISDSIVALVTKDGVHCLDSNAADPADPQWLVDQRQAEVDQIHRWLTEYTLNLDTEMQ